MFLDNIDKRKFWKYVNKKMSRVIHHYHVLSIINILFDEMLIDLLKFKEIKIFNFGTFFIKKTLPRKYHNVKLKKVMKSNGNRIMKFNLSRKIKKNICKFIDIDATFKGD